MSQAVAIWTKLLTKDETRRIAANIAKLPSCCGSARAQLLST